MTQTGQIRRRRALRELEAVAPADRLLGEALGQGSLDVCCPRLREVFRRRARGLDRQAGRPRVLPRGGAAQRPAAAPVGRRGRPLRPPARRLRSVPAHVRARLARAGHGAGGRSVPRACHGRQRSRSRTGTRSWRGSRPPRAGRGRGSGTRSRPGCGREARGSRGGTAPPAGRRRQRTCGRRAARRRSRPRSPLPVPRPSPSRRGPEDAPRPPRSSSRSRRETPRSRRHGPNLRVWQARE